MRMIRYRASRYQYFDFDKARKIFDYVPRDVDTILAEYLQDKVMRKGVA